MCEYLWWFFRKVPTRGRATRCRSRRNRGWTLKLPEGSAEIRLMLYYLIGSLQQHQGTSQHRRCANQYQWWFRWFQFFRVHSLYNHCSSSLFPLIVEWLRVYGINRKSVAGKIVNLSQDIPWFLRHWRAKVVKALAANFLPWLLFVLFVRSNHFKNTIITPILWFLWEIWPKRFRYIPSWFNSQRFICKKIVKN